MDNDITKEPNTWWLSGNPVKDTLWAWLKAQPQTDTVTITSAEVLLLMSAPKELVAAPGADKYLEFISATLILEYGSNIFSEDDDNFAIRYTNGSGVIVSDTIQTTGFINQGADTITRAIPVKDAIVAAASCVNKSLVLDNIGDAEIGGNAGDDNVLRVKITYLIRDAGLA